MYQETEQNPFENESDVPLDLYEPARYQADPVWDRWLRDLGNDNDEALWDVANVAVPGID